MIRINLLPAEEAQRAAGRRQELAVGALALGGLTLLIVLAHSWTGARLVGSQRELGRIAKELAVIQGPYADATRLEQQKKELREKLRVIGELEAKKVGPVHVLADLSNATPDKLWLLDFAETDGAIRLSGMGVDEQTVADFLRRLGTSTYFQNVDLEETSLVDQEGIKHKKFVIKGQVNYLGTSGAAQARASAAAPGQGAAR